MKAKWIFTLLIFPLLAFCQDFYPIQDAYEEHYLKVSELHSVFYAQYGNPEGVPVLVLHGGPGGGCMPSWSNLFDPSFYRVIMLDQRGAGRSLPAAEMKDNTPSHLISDIEMLRTQLKIDQWLIFGGSWGSTLAILYGEAHPEKVLGFILRGIFTGREEEYLHLMYGMRKFFPEAWEEMVALLPQEEQSDLISALHKRLMNPDPKVHLPAAHAFMRYDTICGSLLPDPDLLKEQAEDDASALNVARAFIHYAAHQFFLEPNQLQNDIKVIAHLPAIVIHGRHDHICPPSNAYDICKLWPASDLRFISDGGHFTSEPSISKALKEALDEMRLTSLKPVIP